MVSRRSIDMLNKSKAFYKQILCCATISSAVLMAGTSASAANRVWVNGTVLGNAPIPGLPVGGSVVSGAATFDETASRLQIDQQSGRAIIDWQSFDIGEANLVEFRQPDASAAALNRVTGAARPSQILGSLQANGQVYLINQNGILFGDSAQVNVGGLVASTLDINEDLFLNSSIAQSVAEGEPAFMHDDTAAADRPILMINAEGEAELAASVQGQAGDILIAEGAEINTANNGSVLVFAPNIRNEGKVSTPEGQTLMAAAEDEVFLLFSDSNPDLRGFLVEVETGGNITNVGEMVAERGNITLLGMAVNQEGTLRATTSVDLNGTIRLLARDSLRQDVTLVNETVLSSFFDNPDERELPTVPGGTPFQLAERGGNVRFAEGSVTEILPELDNDATAPDVQPQNLSRVEVVAENIHMEQGSSIIAAGGNVQFLATSTPNNHNLFFQDNADADNSRIFLDSGSLIDVSGTEVQLAADANVIEVELRGNELQDSPLQRDGILNGSTVYIDARKGTDIANISGAVDSTPRTVAERLTEGGSVQLLSRGDVIQREGSVIDVSGGTVHYQAGIIETTKLISEGRVYDISDADPDRIYDGILGDTAKLHERWGITEEFSGSFIGMGGEFVEAYSEGRDAGNVSIVSRAAILEGEIRADTITGPFQRDVAANNFPRGGQLDLFLINNKQNIIINAIDNLLNPAFDEDLLAEEQEAPGGTQLVDLSLSERLFEESGLMSINIGTGGQISIADGVDLTFRPGTNLDLLAKDDINIGGSISTAGGDINIRTVGNAIVDNILGRNRKLFDTETFIDQNSSAPITLQPGSVLDTRGLWINDDELVNTLFGNADVLDTPLWIDGGNVVLVANGDLTLAQDSLIDTGGGAHFSSNGQLLAGKGGDISLAVNRAAIDLLQDEMVSLTLEGKLQSFAFNQGGTLSLEAPGVYITSDDLATIDRAALNLDESVLLRNSSFFNEGGFSAYNLTAFNSLTIAENTVITPEIQNLATFDQLANNPLISTGVNNRSVYVNNDLLTLSPELSTALVNNDISLDQAIVAADVFMQLPADIFSQAILQNNAEQVLIDNGIAAEQAAVLAAFSAELRYLDNADLILRPTGTDISQFTSIARLPDFQREPVDLSFTLRQSSSFSSNQSEAVPFVMQSGSVIDADAGASIVFTSDSSLYVNGSVLSPAGNISLNLLPDRTQQYHDDGAIWLGAASRLFAGATALLEPNELGLRQGRVLDAGTVSLNAEQGFIIAEAGADINVSGTAQALDFLTQTDGVGVEISVVDVAADAGTIKLTAAEGIIFEGSLNAQAANIGGASGGRLELVLDSNLREIFTDDPSNSTDGISFAAHELFIRETPSTLIADNFAADFDPLSLGQTDVISDDLNAQAVLAVETLQVAGFDQLDLAVSNTTISGESSSQIAVDQNGNPAIGRIVFDGNVALTAKQSIVLRAPTLATSTGNALVAAPYIRLGTQSDILSQQQVADVSGGQTSLTLLASNTSSDAFAAQLAAGPSADYSQFILSSDDSGLLEVVGHASVNGADQVNLLSSGDIRLRGLTISNDVRRFGSFSSFSDLTLQADQVYPDTLSEFVLSVGQRSFEFDVLNLDDMSTTTAIPNAEQSFDVIAGSLAVGDIIQLPVGLSQELVDFSITNINETLVGDSEGRLTILPGSADSPVLSAAGSLVFDAPVIDQQGVVKAPVGNIIFNTRATSATTGAITFANSSITSVSAEEQLIPFGEVQANISWVYDPANGGIVFVDSVPEKNITINSAVVDLQQGSVVNLSGDGDLLAYEFIPGPGGSRDILALENSGGSFAILPTLGQNYAPYDASIYAEEFAFQPGQSIFLNGVGDLASGEYAILPPRYASLPGAYLITPSDQFQNILPGQTFTSLNGADVVAGRFTIADSDIYDSQWSSFVIEPGSIAATRSEFNFNLASEFFVPGDNGLPVSSPHDAGSLLINASSRLNLEASFLSDVAGSGRGSQLDIVSDRLSVVSRLSNNVSVVEILDSQLSSINVDSVLLGGRRVNTAQGVRINIGAEQVVVGENSNISAPDIILAANDLVAVNSGATISGSGDSVAQAPTFLLDGDAALLRISAGPQAQITPTNTTGASGILQVADGAQLSADGSMLFFATADTQIDGNILMNGGSINIGSGLISLGDVPATVNTGLVFSNADLAALTVDELILTSGSSIDFYSDINLSFTDVELRAAALRGADSTTNNVTINAANTLELNSPVNSLAALASTGTGSLDLNAAQLTLGQGAMAIVGFDQVNLSATAGVIGDARGQFQINSNNNGLSIQAPVITATGAANTNIISDGQVTLAGNGDLAANILALQGLGSQLSITGSRILHQGQISLPSGTVTLDANGNDSADGVILSNATIDVAGQAVQFGEQLIASSGGDIRLSSLMGDVDLQVGSILNMSGVSGDLGSDAGGLSIRANVGQAFLNADINAGSGANAKGASFALDVAQLDNFSALLSGIQSANFTESVDIRQRNGSINVLASDSINASNIRLTADAGDISIAGTLDASGDAPGVQAGRIDIFADGDLTLESSAQLISTAQEAGVGGRIWLAVKNGVLNLLNGAGIDVTGNSRGGELALRVSRQQLANSELNATVTGADRVNVEAFATYNTNTVNQALIAQARSDADAFMGALNTNGLGSMTALPEFLVLPGVEIISGSDLNIADSIDLSSWRYGNEAGILSLNAAGDINVNATINDGFETRLVSNPPGFEQFCATIPGFCTESFVLASGNSWSYRIVGGADQSSANVLAVNTGLASGVGDLTVAADAAIRTGTGDIDVVAAGDITLLGEVDNDGVLVQTASIYTVGAPDATNPLGSFSASNQTANITFNLIFEGLSGYNADGGDINIFAGGDIVSANQNSLGDIVSFGSDQLFTDWLQRISGPVTFTGGSGLNLPTTWVVAFEDFAQNVAALGGGDINIRAGGDINSLSASIPTTGKQIGELEPNLLPNSDGFSYVENNLEINGGGDLNVVAGNDILSANFYLGDGHGDIQAGGNIAAANNGLNTILALGEGQFDLQADGSIALETALNTTVLAQSTAQSSTNADVRNFQSYFFTYSDDSAVNLTSLSGDILFSNNTDAIRAAYPQLILDVPAATNLATIYPPTVNASALQGSINIAGVMDLYPSSQGGMRLLAANNIQSSDVSGSVVSVNISDVDPALLPQAEDSFTGIPELFPSENIAPLFEDSNSRLLHAAVPLHADLDSNNDGAVSQAEILADQAIILIAQSGDISNTAQNFILSTPKKALISAGRDISNITLNLQNVNARDISLVQAGRDIVFPIVSGPNNDAVKRISVAGPGRLDVIAGRNVNLGASDGIRSIGNSVNPVLAEGGAAVSLLVGVGDAGQANVASQSFVERYFQAEQLPTEDLVTFVLSDAFDARGDILTPFVSEVTLLNYKDDSNQANIQYDLTAARADMANLSFAEQQMIAFRALAFRSIESQGQNNNIAGRVPVGSEYVGDLIEYVTSSRFNDDWFAAVNYTPDTNLSPAQNRDQAMALLAALPLAEQYDVAFQQFQAATVMQQRPLILNAYYNEIRQGGIVNETGQIQNPATDGFARSVAAVDTLFPADNYQGDLSLIFSTLQTEDGGNLNFLIPGGSVDVGITGEFAGLEPKAAVESGIITRSTGDINGMLANSINVNTSRVFTLDGGDILLWATEGNIDAGRGAKTAISTSPPRIVLDENGNPQTEFSAAVAGSGIRSSRFSENRKGGNVLLFAPQGIIDAGDAGIGSDGNLLVAAQQVVNADNIQSDGISIGVPVTTGVSASLAAASSAGTSATDAATDDASKGLSQDEEDQSGVAFVTVELIGFGDDEEAFLRQ